MGSADETDNVGAAWVSRVGIDAEVNELARFSVIGVEIGALGVVAPSSVGAGIRRGRNGGGVVGEPLTGGEEHLGAVGGGGHKGRGLVSVWIRSSCLTGIDLNSPDAVFAHEEPAGGALGEEDLGAVSGD